MNKKISNALKYLIFLGIGIFLVWWSLRQIPTDKWAEFKEALLSANFWLLIPVFLILSTSHVLRAIRWRTLMRPMGYNPSLLNTFFAVMIGYLANLAVPRLGEVLKCTILAKYENVPAEKLVGTIVVERATDILCLGVVFLIAFVAQYAIVSEYARQVIFGLLANKGGHFSIPKVITGVAILVIAVVIARKLLRKYAHLSIVIGIQKIVNGIWEGLSSIKNLQEKGTFVVCTIGIWALYIAGTWVGLMATSGTANLGPGVAISALAFASIGMIATPGGIGAYAFFLAKVLEKNNVSFEVGYANGTLQWFAQFLIVVIVGFICLGLLPWHNKKIRTHEIK